MGYDYTGVKIFLPLARRLLKVARPALVDIFVRNPCLFARFRLEGWYVMLIGYFSFSKSIKLRISHFRGCTDFKITPTKVTLH